MGPNGDARLVQELFARYPTGRYSIFDLVRYQASEKRKLSRFAVCQILKRRTYLGKVPYGKSSRSQFSPRTAPFDADGLHTSLVDEATFQQVQSRLAANYRRKGGGPHPRHLLTGFLRCGKCGHAMTGRTKQGRNGQKWGQYECARRLGFKDCDQPTMFATRLEPQVKARVMVLLERARLADVRQRAKDLAATVIN